MALIKFSKMHVLSNLRFVTQVSSCPHEGRMSFQVRTLMLYRFPNAVAILGLWFWTICLFLAIKQQIESFRWQSDRKHSVVSRDLEHDYKPIDNTTRETQTNGKVVYTRKWGEIGAEEKKKTGEQELFRYFWLVCADCAKSYAVNRTKAMWYFMLRWKWKKKDGKNAQSKTCRTDKDISNLSDSFVVFWWNSSRNFFLSIFLFFSHREECVSLLAYVNVTITRNINNK